jgi:hypothetical protein
VCFIPLYKVSFGKYLKPEVEDARKNTREQHGTFFSPELNQN